MKQNVFEESTYHVYCSVSKGAFDKLQDKKVTWTFKETGGQSKIGINTVDIDAGNKSASAKVTFPKVKDTEDSYEVSYTTKANKETSHGKDTFVVWPKTIQIKAFHKVDGAEQPCKDFLFKVRVDGDVAEADAELHTDDQGVHEYACRKADKHEFLAVSPWVIDKWKTAKGRKREVLVSRKPYKAELVWPAKGGPHKQYVNLPVNAWSPWDGHRLQLRVGAQGDQNRQFVDRLGLKDDEIFLEVEFGEKNSDRDDPKPRLIVGGADVAAEADGRTFKATLKLKDNGDPAEAEIELGYAGGDECEIRVGVTKDASDAKAKIVNWRKVAIDMVQPLPDVVSSYTVLRSDKQPGMGKAEMDAFTKALKPVFIDFVQGAAITFDAADIGPSAAWRIHDASYFKKLMAGGKKVFTGTFDLAGALRAAKGPAAPASNSFITSWADFLFDPTVQAVTFSMESKKKKYSVPNGQVYGFYKYDPTEDAQTLGITRFAWRASHWKGKGIGRGILGTWHEITDAADPGAAVYDWRDVPLDWDAHLQHFVKFVDYQTLEISLPARAGEAGDPGHFLKVDGHDVRIEVYIALRAAYAGANAGGWHGFIDMSTMAGKYATGGLVSTLLHELGHNMGQGYADKTVDLVYGNAAGSEIPGVPFAAGVPGGYLYGDHGHTGVHCAFGVSDGDRGDDPYGAKQMKQAKCVMFGAGDMNSSKLLTFCEKCEPYVKAQDASDLSKHWEA